MMEGNSGGALVGSDGNRGDMEHRGGQDEAVQHGSTQVHGDGEVHNRLVEKGEGSGKEGCTRWSCRVTRSHWVRVRVRFMILNHLTISLAPEDILNEVRVGGRGGLLSLQVSSGTS